MLQEEKHFNTITVDSQPHQYHHFNHPDQYIQLDVCRRAQIHDASNCSARRFITALPDEIFPSAVTATTAVPRIALRGCPSFADLTKKTLALFLITLLLVSTCCDARHILQRQLLESGRMERSLPPTAKSSSLNRSASVTTTHSKNFSSLLPPSPRSGAISSTSAPAPSSDIPAPPAANSTTEKSQLISALISTLQRLQLLESSTNACYRVNRIVRRDAGGSPPPSPSAQQTTSQGYYTVNILIEKIVLTNEGEPVTVPSKGKTDPRDKSASGKERTVIASVCLTDTAIEFLNDTTNGGHGDRDGSGGVFVGGSNQNGAAVTTSAAVTSDPRNLRREDDTPNGLSRTQIVVISTCSAIIGMFFLVAGILRIRNYIKRLRMEQALANRPKFRSCSVALRNPTQSMEQLRRDSTASKTSHQNSVTTKGSNGSQTNGSSRENSSASSPRHEPDTAPLLIITRPADLSNSAESNSSLQYNDEDSQATKKKTAVPVSIVKNGGPDGCYIVSLRQAQLGHVPLSLVERAGSLKGRSHLGMERGSSLKGRPNPKVGMERRTSLKIIMPSSQGNGGGVRDVQKSMKFNGQIGGRGKEGVVSSPKVNGEPQVYQLVSSPDILQADKCKAIYIEPRRNGSWERALCRAKGYQIVSGEDNEATFYDNNTARDNDRPQLPAAKTYTSAEVMERKNSNDSSVEDTDARTPESIETSCQNTEPGTGAGLISPTTETSYFGLSQSDVSLSSATNQGNEFFGQTEYHPEECDTRPCGSDEMTVSDADFHGCAGAPANSSTTSELEQNLHSGAFVNRAFSPTSPQEPRLNGQHPDFSNRADDSFPRAQNIPSWECVIEKGVASIDDAGDSSKQRPLATSSSISHAKRLAYGPLENGQQNDAEVMNNIFEASSRYAQKDIPADPIHMDNGFPENSSATNS
ncbi:hypothetical protein Btru_033367 [Bulinus truncatus]|nr:hypothetical protein Btru_033367 [Bulinus truncatus]